MPEVSYKEGVQIENIEILLNHPRIFTKDIRNPSPFPSPCSTETYKQKVKSMPADNISVSNDSFGQNESLPIKQVFFDALRKAKRSLRAIFRLPQIEQKASTIEPCKEEINLLTNATSCPTIDVSSEGIPPANNNRKTRMTATHNTVGAMFLKKVFEKLAEEGEHIPTDLALAERIGLHRSTISIIRSGKRGVGAELILAIYRTFKIPIETMDEWLVEIRAVMEEQDKH